MRNKLFVVLLLLVGSSVVIAAAPTTTALCAGVDDNEVCVTPGAACDVTVKIVFVGKHCIYVH